MDQYLDNEYVVTALYLVAVLYATMAQVELPSFVRELFKNDIFRVMFLSLLLIVRFEQRPSVAVLIVMIYMYTMYLLNRDEVNENVEHFQQLVKLM